jgi:hypothetical protein
VVAWFPYINLPLSRVIAEGVFHRIFLSVHCYLPVHLHNALVC